MTQAVRMGVKYAYNSESARPKLGASSTRAAAALILAIIGHPARSSGVPPLSCHSRRAAAAQILARLQHSRDAT
jgi:hypothetical protein